MRNDRTWFPEVVDDVHAGLNRTRVAARIVPRSIVEARGAIAAAALAGRSVAIAGARHAMGGQQFLRDGILIDTTRLDRVLKLDAQRGLLWAEAGVRWPALIAWLRAAPENQEPGWTIRQKQTGADDFTLGGAVAANIHGRGLSLAPFAADVEALELIDAAGRTMRLSRAENSDWFALALGGYGLFGLVTRVQLRLVRRARLLRRVALVRTDGLIARFERAVADGARYGDFQFDIDPASADCCARGILSCYAPAARNAALDAPRRLDPEQWRRLLALAHTDKTRAFEEYADFYLGTDGQTYDSDTQQTGVYVGGYHAELDGALGHRGSEMIAEWFVPRERLARFLGDVSQCLRARRADPVYGTVRLIERDADTRLPWARERWACVVLNLHVAHARSAIERAQRTFRALNDLALELRGSFYLTYHRWASAAQIEAAYPDIREWLRLKRAYDPQERFASDWYRHLARAFGARPR